MLNVETFVEDTNTTYIKENALHSPPSSNVSTTNDKNETHTTVEDSSLEDDHKTADSSDEEEPKVYNIQMGKPIVPNTTSVILPATAADIVNTIKQNEIVEIVENIKNENKEVNDKESSGYLQKKSNDHTKNEIDDPSPIPTPPPSHIVINKNLENLQKTSEPSSRAESPLWTYTLPAPPKFADSDGRTVSTNPPEYFNGHLGSPDTQTIVSDSSSLTAIPDSPIRPIITERLPLDFQAFNDSSTVVSDNDERSGGYNSYSEKFSREALLESLELRRDQFIENEFDFLTKMEQEPDAEKPVASRQVSTESARSNILNELNQALLSNNNTLTRKPQETRIEAAAKSSLSNFSIQTYTGDAKESISTTPPKTTQRRIIPLPDSSDDEAAVFTQPAIVQVKRIVSADSTDAETIIKKHADPEFYKSTDLTPKRSSITSINGGLFKSPNRVNRSDSFHSTRTDELTNGMTPRSSSYISLIGAQKFENTLMQRNLQFSEPGRRKSTSIADLPSLQSVSVMKSILSNSRKNSYSNINENAGTGASITDVRRNSAEPTIIEHPKNVESIDSLETNVFDEPTPSPRTSTASQLDSNGNADSSKENSPNNKSKIVSVPQKPLKTEGDNKKWRYQGPPAINLSTWGERPKSMVSIKTDNDNAKNATPTVAAPIRSPTIIANERSNGVSITHQPLVEKPVDAAHLPIVLGVVKKTNSTVTINDDLALSTLKSNRLNYEISTLITSDKSNGFKVTTTSIPTTNTMTLGRVPIPNRFSANHSTTSSHTFVMRHSKETPSPVLTTTAPNFKVDSPVREIITNHSRDGDTDSGYKSMPAVYTDRLTKLAKPSQTPTDEKEFPFSQLTLRKTGLKEKILADTERLAAVEQQQGVVQTSTVQVQLRPHSTAIYTRAMSMPVAPVAKKLTITNIPSAAPETSLPKRTVIAENSSTLQTRTVTSIPPPPPPLVPVAPTIRAVTVKKGLPPLQAVPHDQLLDSIRNFSKANLKKK